MSKMLMNTDQAVGEGHSKNQGQGQGQCQGQGHGHPQIKSKETLFLQFCFLLPFVSLY